MLYVLLRCVCYQRESAALRLRRSAGAGSTWSLGDAAVDFGCADLAVNGTLDVSSANVRNTDSVQINAGGTVNGGTGTLGLTGDFSNAGTFSKGTGTVSIADGCGNTTSTIAGSQSFRRFR